jgi:hypothetical protein
MRFGFPVLAALLVAACAAEGSQFTTQLAPDFVPGRQSVSVLGVYADGRMSGEAWERRLGQRLSPSLGAPMCDAGYSTLSGPSPLLLSAIDDYTRAEGPSDALLAQLAPAAKGDLIVVVTVAGRVPPPPASSSSPRASAPGNVLGFGGGGGGRGMGGGGMGGGRGGGGRGGGGRAPSSAASAPERSTLEMSASFYSVGQHRPVALVAMQYDGPSFDDAVAKFAQKLAAAMPGTTCVGWDWDIPIDPQHLRDTKEE